MGNWKKLAEKAPRWAKFWLNELAKQILYDLCFHRLLFAKEVFCSSQHNDFLYGSNQGKDIEGLDFAALDKLAEDWQDADLEASV